MLTRLEGVKTVTNKKSVFTVKVLENKAILPSKIAKMVEEQQYSLDGFTLEAAGTVEKAGDGWVFVARANGTKYTLKANDDAKKLIADGRLKLVITGDVVEPEEKDGKKPLPVIEVSGAKELKEEPKK